MFNFLKKTSYTFEGKKDQESVVLFLHRHWFVLAKKTTLLLLMALVPILLLVVLGQLILQYSLIPLFTFLWAGYIMVLWYYLFYVLTMYTLDYWIITNERVVNNVQHGFFNRKISELSIHMIQDISVKLVGLVPTTLNFGSVEVQTAAQEGHFLLEDVPKPQTVKDKIMEIIEKTEDEYGPRMHGMAQRHHFHPEYTGRAAAGAVAVGKMPQSTGDILSQELQKMAVGSAYEVDENEDSETRMRRQIEEAEDAQSHDNNVPPNLPL